jgi:hypothetical protein
MYKLTESDYGYISMNKQCSKVWINLYEVITMNFGAMAGYTER